MKVDAGSVNVSVYYYIVQDASGTSPGEPVTGLLFSDIETGGSASYARQGAARVDLTLITLASASAGHADGGFILVDDTNMPGLYRCDYPDAAFVAGVDQTFCQIVVASANNAVAAPILVDIEASVAQSADHTSAIADVPTVSEFNARTIVAADYFDPAADTVANVTLVATTTTNTDMRGTDGVDTSTMRGTDSAATSAKQDTMETTLNAIPTTAMRGTDSAATSAKQDTMETTLNAIPTTAMRGTDNAATEAKQDIIDTNVDTLITQIGTAGAGLSDLGGMSTGMKAEVLTEVVKLLVTQMTESYAADGVAPTMTQALMLIQQVLTEFSIAGTSNTAKKIDGSTTAAIMTLNDSANPTSSTRTS